MNTPVRVRAQANGGKYIGPAVATPPSLSVFVDGRMLIPDVTIPNLASGTVVNEEDATSSPHTIVVQPPGAENVPPGRYWLDPPADGQADIIVTLPLPEPAYVEFRVEAYAPQPVQSSVTELIEPGGSYTANPGIVVPVPGLYVPQFTATCQNGTVTVQAKVQMMCGCPITLPPAPAKVEPYWPSYEFEVTASFVMLGALPVSVPMKCTGTDEFKASLTLSAGTYNCLLSALQPSTKNSGSASTQLVVQP